MGFYTLDKSERALLVQNIEQAILKDINASSDTYKQLLQYAGDEDTYIRKATYLTIGKIFLKNLAPVNDILLCIKSLYINDDFKVRQTAINAAGEIGKTNFPVVQFIFDEGLKDIHHAPRNAVIGSIKKMSEKNPVPVLAWAQLHILHPDTEIRREICHGIELRGRAHPMDILPLLKLLQHDTKPRVRNTLIHVIGQIAYKKGCLEQVIHEIKTWENKILIKDAVDEIIDVHDRYRDFSFYTQAQAIAIISQLEPFE